MLSIRSITSLSRMVFTGRKIDNFPRYYCSEKKINSVTILQSKDLVGETRKNDIEDDFRGELQETFDDDFDTSLLEPVKDETAIDVEPNIMPTFNFAPYVSRSETLQKLLDLNVNLYKIERRKGLLQFLMPLDFERDMQKHILFLTKHVGLEPDCLGKFFTKNPLIFKEEIDVLETRVNYLESKSFTADDIRIIVENDPFWLMFSTKRIDARLGFFQKQFQLTGNQIRQLTVSLPRLITWNLEKIREQSFSIKEEMNLTKEETRQLLLSKPKIWLTCKLRLYFLLNFLFDFISIIFISSFQLDSI